MEQQLRWKYVSSIYLKRKHVLVFRDSALGLQMQVISRVSRPDSVSRKLYFIDGDNRAYATEADLIRALADGAQPASMGLHPLYVQCVPWTAPSATPSPDITPRFPSLLQQGQRWLAGLAQRLATQALQAGGRFPLHRPTR
jgi:hypothetical protein